MRIFNILLLFFLTLIKTSTSNNLELISIEPNKIIKSFASKIDDNNVEIIVKNDYDNIMLFIGSVIEPYDEPPGDWDFDFCYDTPGKVIVDWNHEDEYKYSCCVKKSNHTYKCPVAMPEVNPDPFRTLINDDINNVYIKEYNKSSKWKLTDKTIVFMFDWNFQGFLKRFITVMLILSVSVIVVSGIISRMNFFSNKYPLACLIIHLIITTFSVLMEYNLYNMSFEDKSSRGKTLRQGIIFSILTIIYSLFLIYIPSRKDPQDPNTIEQRITIKKDNNYYKIIKLLKHKYVKETFSLIFVFFLFYQFVSIYSLVEASREYLELEWDGLLAIVIAYIVLEVIFLVAYMSALYEIKIPIRFDDTTGQVMQFLPETIHRRELQAQRITRKVNPKNPQRYNRNNFGFYQRGNLVNFDHSLIKAGDLILIDEDHNNYETHYNYLVWKVGYLKAGSLIINEEYLHTNRVKGCCNKKHGEVEIISREKDRKISLYSVVKIDETKEFKFIKYGYVTGGYLHQDYQIILDTVSSLMKIIPEYTPDYNYNIVENLRTECHRLTRKIGVYYSYLYLTLFGFCTINEIARQINYGINYMNLFFVLLMICFAINVNTKISKNPVLKKSKNFRKINLNTLKLNHRGDNDITKCKLSFCNIVSNPIEKNISPEKYSDFYIYNFNDLNYDFFVEINLPLNFDFIGIGVLNNNEDILKRISPGMIVSGNENLIKIISKNQIDNHKYAFSKIGFGRLKNRYILYSDEFYQIKYTTMENISIISDNENLMYNLYKLVYPELNKISFLPKITNCSNEKVTISLETSNLTETSLKLYGSTNKPIKVALLEENKDIDYWSIYQNIPKYLILNKSSKNGFLYILEDEITLNEIFEFKLNVTYQDFSQVNFVSIGLIENSYLYHNKFLDVVPGWDTSRSIGYHSDDGSICISDNIKTESYINDSLSWFPIKETFEENNKKSFSLTVGFDGIWLYFENERERFGLTNYNLLVNKKNLLFSPILYIDGLVKKELSIELVIT